MIISIADSKERLGKAAAEYTAKILNEAIEKKGKARMVVSTGTSQNETIDFLIREEIDWKKVELFHLDEYVGLPQQHPASFRKYLRERIVNKVRPLAFHFVETEGDVYRNIEILTEQLREEPITIGLIGIGENSHIAFNDPPADFETRDAYIIVDLDEACKRQQVGESWFPTMDDVPKQAVSMTVYQIMKCEHIVSSVPDKRKAAAIRMTFENKLTNRVPATMLKRHPNWALFLDLASASELDFYKFQNA